MKLISLLRRARVISVALVVLCFVLTGVSLWHSFAENQNKAAEARRQFNARLQDGVGSEIRFAKHGDDTNNVRASVNSLAHFMFVRSGVKLSGHTKNRLASMEASTHIGSSRRILPDELSDILAVTAMERVSTLRDDEINHAAETLRGFDASDLPDSFRRGRDKVKMRASKAGSLTPDQFIAQAKTIRGADDTSRNIFKGAAKNTIAPEIQDRIKFLSEALPEQFGAASNGLTPMQSVLIAYSVVSDDVLADSEINLPKRMKSIQEGISKATGQSYASPDGHFAYGVNGYIFSTPLDLVFDDQTMNVLLDHIQERSANQ